MHAIKMRNGVRVPLSWQKALWPRYRT